MPAMGNSCPGERFHHPDVDKGGGGGVVPQVIKKKGKGWVGKLFFSLL